MITNMIAYIIATLSLFPLLSFALFYVLIYVLTKNKSSAFHWAINISTLPILISVSVSVRQLWEVNIGWILILILLLLVAGLTYLQFYVRGQIDLMRLTRGVIRLSFMIFLPIHVVLYIWMVIRAMITASS